MSLGRPTNDVPRDPWKLFEWLCSAYDEITSLLRRVPTESFVTYTLASGVDNRVQHGLPGTVATWVVVDKNANADVWKSTTVNPDRSVILLAASATVTVKLRFT